MSADAPLLRSLVAVDEEGERMVNPLLTGVLQHLGRTRFWSSSAWCGFCWPPEAWLRSVPTPW